MRCKACNKELKDYESFSRTIKENGKEYTIEEDLCKPCRTDLYHDSDELQIDPMSLGIDVVMEDDGI